MSVLFISEIVWDESDKKLISKYSPIKTIYWIVKKKEKENQTNAQEREREI